MNTESSTYWTHPSGCPRLFLAPMEGLGDAFFRRAYRHIGACDEASTEFIRVPRNAHCESLARRYRSDEMGDIPLAAQVMGEDPDLICEMVRVLEGKGAPRIDLNCGCPSNTVVGRGAGSSLLRTPERLHAIASQMVKAVDIPVTVKLRSGYDDTSLFKENLLAAQEAGIAFLTLHPRTKRQGYTLPCPWELIAEAKDILCIPVVGSGEIRSASDAQRMHRETGCDGLMVGRQAVRDPWIFHRIKASYSGLDFAEDIERSQAYLRAFAADLAQELCLKTQVNKLKQIANFMFECDTELVELRRDLLRLQTGGPEVLLEGMCAALRQRTGQKRCDEIQFSI